MPQPDRFVVHILIAVAEQEAEAISKRTKAAPATARAPATKLGGRRALADLQRLELRLGQCVTRKRAKSARISFQTSSPYELPARAHSARSGRTQRSRDPNAPKSWGMACGAGARADGRATTSLSYEDQVRGAFCWSRFPLVRPLPSISSATDTLALFGDFFGTTSLSDFPCSFIIGSSS